MNFKTFHLIIEGKNPIMTDINKVVTLGATKHENGSEVYLIERKMIEDRFLWMYCQYENAKLYGDVVLDTEKSKKHKNTRKKNEIELRKQLFVVFDTKDGLLYMSDMSKKSFVRSYIHDVLQVEVIIKNIYASLEEFQNSIKLLKKLKFTQYYNVQNMLTNDSIFMQQANALGLDLPNKITMQIEYENSLVNKIKEGLQVIKTKRDQGFFSDIILVGEDDQGIEQSFDFTSMIKNIWIHPTKNENERFDEDEIERLFFEKIRSQNV